MNQQPNHQGHYAHTPPPIYQMYSNTARPLVLQERLQPLHDRPVQEYEYAINGQDPTWLGSGASSMNSINFGPVTSHQPSIASNEEGLGSRHPSNQPVTGHPQAPLAQGGLPGPLSASPAHTSYSIQTQEVPQGQRSWLGSSIASNSEGRSAQQRFRATSQAAPTPPSEDNFSAAEVPVTDGSSDIVKEMEKRLKNLIKSEVAGLQARQDMAVDQLNRIRDDIPRAVEASERRVTTSVRDVENNVRDLIDRIDQCRRGTTKIQEVLSSFIDEGEPEEADDDTEKRKRRKRGGK